MKHIICFHLFNDYSGSPKVLCVILKELIKKGYCVDLFTSSGGVLDDIKESCSFKIHHFNYKFSRNKLVTLFYYIKTQCYFFFQSFNYYKDKDAVFYINTILPIGAVLAARIMRKRIVYHYHENAVTKSGVYVYLCKIMQKFASVIICVSRYQTLFLKRKKNVIVIPNSIDEETVSRLQEHKNIDLFNNRTVLMLSSLKKYKGVIEFIQLAYRMSDVKFILVINDIQESINKFLSDNSIKTTPNLRIYPKQNDVVPFYKMSSIVLNLSNPTLFVETFGMTVLEAFTSSLPVIVPPVGGIAETVIDNKNGYKIDVREISEIENKIKELLNDKELYYSLSRNACMTSDNYKINETIKKIIGTIEG